MMQGKRSIRVWRHVLLGGGAIAATAALFALLGDGTTVFRISLSTAYVALMLFAVTFALGPLYVLATKRSPVSTYLRRDISIWGGVFALIHTAAGLFVHFGGRIWPYFFFEDWHNSIVPVRYDAFGIANYTGAVAAVIVLVLLAISNNASMRRLGPPRWKALQRSSYAIAALTLVHTLIYQMLEQRAAPGWAAFWLVVAIVVALRLVTFAQQRGARRATARTERQSQ